MRHMFRTNLGRIVSPELLNDIVDDDDLFEFNALLSETGIELHMFRTTIGSDDITLRKMFNKVDRLDSSKNINCINRLKYIKRLYMQLPYAGIPLAYKGTGKYYVNYGMYTSKTYYYSHTYEIRADSKHSAYLAIHKDGAYLLISPLVTLDKDLADTVLSMLSKHSCTAISIITSYSDRNTHKIFTTNGIDVEIETLASRGVIKKYEEIEVEPYLY